ncbi:MAG: DEAD/DEAH box helicase [Patescibacteria group bacterium]|jgi:ATP-dependent RNA helicase RhlE
MRNINRNFKRGRTQGGGSQRSGSKFYRGQGGGGGQRRSRGGGGGRGRGTYIHPDRYINKATVLDEQKPYQSKHTFADFGFLPILDKACTRKGYTTPTAIQDDAIPPILEGKDVIGLANTGSGKTAAFVLPIIQHIVATHTSTKALVVAPTRELAVQIEEEFRAFSNGLRMNTALCVGGASMGKQKAQLARRPQVVIGTPGRLKDLTEQHILKLGDVDVLVLDEVDRMLDMGFLHDVRFLIDKTNPNRQSLCFSATITPAIEKLLADMLKNPVTVSVRTSQKQEHIEQEVIKVRSKEDKITMLLKLLAQPQFDKVLVFGGTKWGVQKLADALNARGHTAQAIHGNKTQPQRQRALRAFKEGKVKVLVATDVAARGLDIPNVSQVVNFDEPMSHDDYIHRIGRTGRAGKAGHALTFVVGG